ncbi:MAG: tRNA (adenosine(37)-N6)-dimethylallyltransferase MiaA [Candidatus Marinimicrobia bacterium]|nr:tRNA (adenosine(37)-N6)-dimethylallyltransferase MiaA [Candidatus Neomarinimicrobiota bacterium]|tara:strand:+ start:1901 stop:2863 length:963 start_codon:yes stop_codon:yes gene_type:complete
MNSTGALSAPKPPFKKVVIIVGSTAVGKSGVAVELALRMKGEVIGLDSRQIYRQMVVGTAQLNEEEQKGVPHHLIGIRDPSELISAGEYAELVEEVINKVLTRGKLPIVCGGSGLYFRALTRGLFEDSSSDLEVRAVLRQRLQKEGADVLLGQLRVIDPDYAEIVHPNNQKRLIRALEVYEITGKPPTEHFLSQKKKGGNDRFLTVYLKAKLEALIPRINSRTEKMIQTGWVDEVQTLLDLGFTDQAHPMDSLGYRDLLRHLKGEIDLKEAVDRIKIETRQYARKQLKWFDKEETDTTLHVDEMSMEKVVDAIQDALNQF